MGFGWQEIDKTLDLGYVRVDGLHRECKPAVLFDPLNFRPRTMYAHVYIVHLYMHDIKFHRYNYMYIDIFPLLCPLGGVFCLLLSYVILSILNKNKNNIYIHIYIYTYIYQACSQVELWGGSFGSKWNSSLCKWPSWLIVFCSTDNLRLKYIFGY